MIRTYEILALFDGTWVPIVIHEGTYDEADRKASAIQSLQGTSVAIRYGS